MKKAVITAVLALMLSGVFSAAHAETRGAIIFRNTAYGALTGALIGGLIMLAEKDKDAEYLFQGAAIGALAGVAIGVYDSQYALEYTDGKMYAGLPTVTLQKGLNDDKRVGIGLFKGSF